MWLISLYLFSTGAIISSLLVVTNAKAINAIISLIVAFINAIGIFMLLGVDFIALIYCIVYVGAIAILFLFVIMLLSDSVNHEVLENTKKGYMSFGTEQSSKTSRMEWHSSPMVVLIGVLYIVEVWCGIAASSQGRLPTADIAGNNSLPHFSGASEVVSLLHNKNCISALGEMLFNECGYEVLLSISLILLVGMIGSIILSLRPVNADV
jgi:NADH:ubiquinone oxidoreductase subunit 6 (subunit J)